MERVYLLSGLGADERLFKKLDLSGYQVTDCLWLKADSADTLVTYATKLIAAYAIGPGSTLIGISLGGMMAVEIARQVPIKNVILLSTIKSIDEQPSYFKFFRKFPLYKYVPDKVLLSLGIFIKLFFFKKLDGESYIFDQMLKDSSAPFLKWAMQAVLYWQGQPLSQPVHHIIGSADLVFNYRRIKNPLVVQDGDHMMVYVKAKEITAIIRGIIGQP